MKTNKNMKSKYSTVHSTSSQTDTATAGPDTGWSTLCDIRLIHQHEALFSQIACFGHSKRRPFAITILLNKLTALVLVLKANSAFHPSGVGKWVPALAGKAKAGMVHSVSRWTRVHVKLWDPFRKRVPYQSALEVCSRRGAIQIHVYLTLPLPYWLDNSSVSSRYQCSLV